MSYTYRQPNGQTKSLTPVNSWGNNTPPQQRSSFKSPIRTSNGPKGKQNPKSSGSNISFAKAFGAVPQMSRSGSQQTFGHARPQTTGAPMRGSSSATQLFGPSGGRPPHPQQHYENHSNHSNPFHQSSADSLTNAQSLLNSAQHQQQQEKLRIQQQEVSEQEALRGAKR